MHLDRLDRKQRETLVAQAKVIGQRYYLAGGTGWQQVKNGLLAMLKKDKLG